MKMIWGSRLHSALSASGLGAAWLLMKAEGGLFDKAVRWARAALLPMAAGLLLVSIATPLVSDSIADRWFAMPNAIGLLPLPLSCLLIFIGMGWLLGKPGYLKSGYAWLLFAGLVVICIMMTLGLAYSIFPDIILNRMTIWQAAAATSSLKFILVGIVLTVPMILGHTVYVYRVFHGKAVQLTYD